MFIISFFVAFSTFFVSICSLFHIAIRFITKKDTKKSFKTFKICAIVFAISFAAMLVSSNGSEKEKTVLLEGNTEEKNEKKQKIEEIAKEDNSSNQNEMQSGENTQSEKSKVYNEEIIFKDILWGSSFPDVNEKLVEWNLWNLSGETYKTCSVDDILLGDYKGIDFDYDGINVISNAFNGEQEVAGYTTSEITLYFAYLPVGEYLSYDEKDTSLYGAQYKFEPVNLQDTYNDLKQKLTDIYGEPAKIAEDNDLWKNKYTYTYWHGQNDTELVLRSLNSENDTTDLYSDEIYITYAWRNGDILLQSASDAVKKEKSDKEKEAQGNENANGL